MRLARPIRTFPSDNFRHLFSSGIERGKVRATTEPFFEEPVLEKGGNT